MLFVSIIWLLSGFWLSSYFSFMLLINLIFIILSGVYFKKKIEGLTGDVYGWMIEGGEMLLYYPEKIPIYGYEIHMGQVK